MNSGISLFSTLHICYYACWTPSIDTHESLCPKISIGLFSPETEGPHISRPQVTSPACNSVTPVREGPGAVEISGGCYSCYSQLQVPDSCWIATFYLQRLSFIYIWNLINQIVSFAVLHVFQWHLFLIKSQIHPNPTNRNAQPPVTGSSLRSSIPSLPSWEPKSRSTSL